MPEHVISEGSQTTNYIQYFIQDNKIFKLFCLIKHILVEQLCHE